MNTVNENVCFRKRHYLIVCSRMWSLLSAMWYSVSAWRGWVMRSGQKRASLLSRQRGELILREPDGGDSAAFSSIFYTLAESYSQAESKSRPLAGNANS